MASASQTIIKLTGMFLSQDDIVSILSALHGLKTTLDDQKLSYTIEKIKGLIPDFKAAEYKEKSSQLVIDLTPWGDNDIQRDKINLLKQAIEGSMLVSFAYTNAKGENTKRDVEPMCLVLKLHTWYLYGFCRNKNDFRFFRLSRIKDLTNLGVPFRKKETSFEMLRKQITEEWSKMYNADIKEEDIHCLGCKSDTHIAYCNICKVRVCSTEKNLDNCSQCNSFGCSKLQEIFSHAPEAKERLEKLRR